MKIMMMNHMTKMFIRATFWSKNFYCLNDENICDYTLYLTARDNIKSCTKFNEKKAALAENWYEVTQFKFWICQINHTWCFSDLIYNHGICGVSGYL